MQIHRIRYTRGDTMTQPGGIILREREEAPRFLVHCFNREAGTLEPSSFFWGHYTDSEGEAFDVFEDKCDRARRYSAGGALIPIASVEAVIAGELAAGREG